MNKKTSILIVDDEEGIRETLKDILSRKGYRTETAETGQEALQKARGRYFNLALLDIRLPDMKGVELIAPLKEMHPDIVVIMATGYASLDTAMQALNEGASAYITKPFNMDEVLVTIGQALEKQRLRDELHIQQIQLEIQNEELRRIQGNLEESRNKYADLYDFAPVGYFTVGQNGLILEANLAGVDLLEISRNALLEQPMSHFVAENSQEVFYLHCQQTFETKARQTCELELVKKDGRQFYAQLESIIVVDSGGNDSQLRMAVMDITERKRAEEALRESEERFRQVVVSISDHIYVTKITEDGSYVNLYLSPHIETLTGYAREKFVANWSFWSSTVIHPDDRTTAANQMTQLTMGQNSEVEYRLIRTGGEVIWVRDSARVQAEGTFKIIYGLVSDITEHKQVEAELKRRNEELRTLNTIATTIGQSLDPDHILNATLDKLLQVIQIDAGWIQLLDEKTGVLSLVVRRGFSQEMAKKIKIIRLAEGITGGVARSGESIVMARVSEDSRFGPEMSGQEALYALVAVPLKSQDKVLGALGVFNLSPRELSSQELQLLTAVGHQIGVAIENLRLAEMASEMEILQEMNRLRSELVANVSHELRTPLGLIKVFCTTLLREDVAFDEETRQEFLRDIDAETDRLEKIVNNLLNLSRMQEGRLHLDKHPIDLGQLITEVTKAMEIQATQHRFVHDFSSEPLVATIDPKYIEQALRNLLGNAIKYSPAGEDIIVHVHRNQGQLIIRITDQGIGIPSQELGQIFDRFYRVEHEYSQRVSGVGLGLAVCQGIVEAHGGRIWVESTPGEGSAFYFTLPVGEVISDL